MKLVDELKGKSVDPRLTFPREEYQRRLDRTTELMRAEGIEVLLCSNTATIGYLTGYDTTMPSGYTVLIVTASGEMTLHCSELEAPCMLLNGLVDDIEVFYWYEAQDTGSDLVRVLRERGHESQKIGIEMGFAETFAAGAFDVKSFLTLQREFPDSELVDSTLLVMEVRLVKQPQELEYMRTAGTYTWAALREALNAIGEGVGDHEVAAAAHHGAHAAGSELMSIDPMVISGPRTAFMPHIAHRRDVAEKGDPVYLEFTGTHNRYNAPSMRSASIGEPTAEVAALADASIATLNLLLENIKPGRTGDDVAQIAKQGLAGVDGLFFHGGYGYSIGLGFQPHWTEAPVYIAEGADRELEPGMTFHLPICIWRPEGTGVGFSESVVVTADGCETLTPNEELALRVK